MRSKEILPVEARLTQEQWDVKFGTFSGDELQFDELITKISRYEAALSEVEMNCYKWHMDKLKKFTKHFVWKRAKSTFLGFNKLNYYFYRDLLSKYIIMLPQAEVFYEQTREKTINKIKI